MVKETSGVLVNGDPSILTYIKPHGEIKISMELGVTDIAATVNPPVNIQKTMENHHISPCY